MYLTMHMKKLLKDIRDNNIFLEVKSGKLQVFANDANIKPDLLAAIKAHQHELTEFLLSNEQGNFNHYFTSKIPAIPVQPDYALSSAQRRLWVLSQTTGANLAYIMSRAYIFEGELNEGALQNALNRLLARHESLRTVFRENEQCEIRQYIYSDKEITFPVQCFDLRNADQSDERLRELVHHETTRAFDLSTGPLVRAGLFRVADNKWVFTYAMHHIIGDGWSMMVLIKELLLLYSALASNNIPSLSPLPIQYKDYEAWQLLQLQDAGLQDHKSYWFRQFEGEVPVLELPADMQRPAIKTYRGGTVSREIAEDSCKRLKELGREHGATLFMTLLAAVNALLYRYTAQEDIVIGSPIAGREHLDLEDQIGFYVNMLALRTRFRGANSFREILNQVKQVTLEAYAHQAYPFDELVHEANLGKDTSRHALFDVVVVLQNTGAEENYIKSRKVGKLTVSGYEDTERVVSLFDLRFDFRETGDILLATIDYNSDIYNKQTIERLGNHLETFIEAIISDPGIPLNDIDYLSATDKQFLLKTDKSAMAGYDEDATIVHLFETQVAKTPDAVAIVYESATLTYNQLNGRANQIAHFLINEGKLHREDRVGILLDRKPDCVATMIGILKAGGMYIPFDTATPEDRLKFMVNDTRMKVIVTEKAYLETVNRLQWSSRHLQTYLCIDSMQVYEEKEQEENLMMNQELWDHVGNKATDQITGGGWISSYTGQPISAEEMEEYAMNAYKKLRGLLHSDMRVLEIGCSSGLTLSKIAPEVALYYGTDLSPVILENTRLMAVSRGYTNVKLQHLSAHEIASLEEKDFDLIIINSVIQHFHGHNYLRKVIKDAIGLLKNQGQIFIGDIMDIERKDALISDLVTFKALNKGKGYTTKTDFSADLFVAPGFFEDLMLDEKNIRAVRAEDKIFSIENELIKYRYDVILEIDKRNQNTGAGSRNKYQFANDILLKQSTGNPALQAYPGNLAYIIYTSGTTGKPKGVMVQHNNVVRLFKTEQPLFDFNEQDVWTMFHSCSFDFSVWEIYGALLFGGKLVLVPKTIAQDAQAYLELLRREQVTVLNQTPSAFYNLVKQELEQQKPELAIRYIIFGGEALSPGRLKEWKERYPATRLINMYGITETTVHVTYKEIGEYEIASNISNIGRPIPTLYCYVLDALQNLLPVGVPGELYVGGEGVARGYLNREELTAQRFIEDPFRKGERLYRSGDKVRMLENGEMEYLGRMDDQVKIRGFRIELGEVQHQLDQYEQISESVVMVKEDQHGQKSLVAYIVGNDKLTVTDLRDYLLSKLPDYMVPAYFVAIDQLPLTANGKVNKKALPDPEGLGISTGVQYVAPRNEVEKELIDIFSTVLNIDAGRISIKDNFFALGGDSIKAMRLVVQIKKQLRFAVNIGNLYKYQTVEELSAWLVENSGQDNTFGNLEKGLKKIEEVRKLIEKENETLQVLPAGYEDIYPVSQVEQGMIYSSMLNMQEPVYYDQFLFQLHIGNYEQFKDGILAMVRRHAILRTRYYVKSFSQPVKVVLESVPLPLNYENITGFSETQKKEYINCFIETDQQIRLQFDDELFWRLKIFQTDATAYTILWSFHHAMLDGWSVSVFCKELAELLSENRGNSLPVLKYSYKDYCAILLARERWEAAEHYWKKLLAGYCRNKLPFNYKGVKISEGNGMKYVSRAINPELLHKLNKLISDFRLSFKAVCVAAHVYLLHIICSEQDVITGVVTHERPELENSEYILGCFLNTIPIRVDMGKPATVLSLLTQVNALLTEVKPYEIHLSEIARIIEEKTTSANPIFDTILNYTDFHLYRDLNSHSTVRAAKKDDGNAELAPINQMTNTLFDVEIGKTLDRFLINIKYAPAYFSEIDVRYALDLYVRILECFTKDVNANITTLNLLTDQDLQETVFGFNATAAPYASEKTVEKLFEEQVEHTPGAVALRQDGIDLTYEELNKRANQLAGFLRTKVKTGDNVGLLVSRSFNMITGMLGILKVGAAYVPIDPEYPLDRQQYIVQNSGVTIVITDENYPLTATEAQYGCININDPAISNHSAENLSQAVSSRQLAYTIYTSGSTGKPKGVMIEHHSVVNLVQWVNNKFSVGHKDKLLFITSMCFDLSVYDIFGILSVGGTVVIARQEELQEIRKLKKLLTEEHITFWDSVPTTMNYLVGELEAESKGFLQHTLRIVFLSGDWIPVHLPDRIKKFFPNANVISLGGATEATVWSNYYPVTAVNPLWSSIPYGKPITNNSFYILDDRGRPVPKGVAGELYIGGVGVAEGYANDKEKTDNSFKKDSFFGNWGGRMYKTGDLGRLMADGNMEFLGRNDNQVKIRGYRVELGEIESALCKINNIKEAIVNVYRDANNNNQLCAYLVLPGKIDVQEVKAALRGHLPEYMVPNQYMILDALPLNSNGKIDRKALPNPTDNKPDEAVVTSIEPVTELETKLAAIWMSILHIDRLGMKDDFFELGANSLSIGAFVNRVHRETNLQLSIREVFTHPTLEGITNVLKNRSSSAFSFIRSLPQQISYPLSSYQRQLWVLNQFEENNLSYHIPGVYVFEGKLNINALERSLKSLIDRHEILRTTFKEDENGEVRQFICSPEEAQFTFVNEDVTQEKNCEQKVKQLVHEQFARPFNLSHGSLIRLALIRFESDKWVFAYTMHHIISDGWSIGILIKELLTLYNAFNKGIQHSLPPLRIQYKDYAAWQQEQLNSESVHAHRRYWLSQFEGELPVLNLPADRRRPAIKTFNGGTIVKTISPELNTRLNALVRECGCTLFMGLLGVINALLYKYTHQEDIIIGTPVAGRNHADLENQIGFYVNTLALRTRFQAANSFVALLETVKQVTLEGYAHQVHPFDELVYDLKLQRDVSRGSLFDVMVILQNTQTMRDRDPFNLGDLNVSGYEIEDNVKSKFDLVFDFVEAHGELQARIEYNSDIYNSETMQRLANHLEQLISAVVEQPRISIEQLDYLSESEKNQLLITFNNTARPYPENATLVRLFEEQVSRTPQATALVGEKEYTYQALNEGANRWAAYLREEYDIMPQDAVGLQLQRSEWLVMAMLGVLKSGATCVPVDPEYPPNRLEYIMQNSKCKVVIDAGMLNIFKNNLQRYTCENPATVSEPHHLAFVIYTSGSTGNPKGCMLKNKGIINHIFSKISLLQLNMQDVICHTSHFHFVGGIWQLLAPLLTGGKVIVCDAHTLKDIDQLLQLVNVNKARILEIIPSQLNEYISHANALRLPHVKTLILTGEKLHSHFIEKCYSDNEQLEIINTYGQTEFSDVTTCHLVPRHDFRENVLVGRPIQNTSHYILSPAGSLCAVGVTGEIYTSGDGIAMGYINSPALTAEKFIENPFKPGHKMFRTGDFGRWLPDGNIEIVGRKDEQVKIRGYRVELWEIESALLQHPQIEEAAVLFLEGADQQKSLVAFLVCKVMLTATQIRAHLSKILPAYMLPARYVQLGAFPLLENGKTNKQELAQYADLEIDSGVEYISPASAVECKLAAIWEKILQRQKFSTLDNFFELGGHSLNATTMINKIKQAFNINISIREIFQYATIKKLSEEIEKKQWLQESKELMKENSDSREIIRI